MLALFTNTITSFFNNFAPLPLTHTQIIKLSNIQLIPALTYRLIYNSLPPPDIHTLDKKIWTHIAAQGKLSLCTPNKTNFSPRNTLGFDITKPSDGIHTQTINHTIRYLRNEGPQLPTTLFLKALNHDTQEANLIQTITSASSYYPNLICHNIPNCNPTDLHKVPPLTTIQVAFDCYTTESPPHTISLRRTTTQNTPIKKWVTGTIQYQQNNRTSVHFGDSSMLLRPHLQFRFPTHPPQQFTHLITFPTVPLNLKPHATFPYPHIYHHSTNHYLLYTTHKHIPKPNPKQLQFPGCHDLLEATTSHPQATICYSHGSDDPNNNRPDGSAIVFVPNSQNNTILAATSPIKGSYPGVIYAIIISLLYPNIRLFPQPLIYAIDNLTTCSNLNLLQSSSTFPFNTNNDSFCRWYLLLWHLLKNINFTIIFTWIKGHANFEGNDMADTVSKWISSHIHVSANQLTPPELPSILHHNTPLPSKISTKYTKHLHSAHAHNKIHLSLSTIFFLTSSWFSRLNFKWVNGLFSCKGYAPHYNLKDYTCPLCLTNHPSTPRPSPPSAPLHKQPTYANSSTTLGPPPPASSSKNGTTPLQLAKNETTSAP